MPSPTDREQTPSPEALEHARGVLEAAIENGRAWGRPSENDIALALDRFAERRGEREINRLRRRVNDYHAWIASLDTGAHLDPPEPEDG